MCYNYSRVGEKENHVAKSNIGLILVVVGLGVSFLIFGGCGAISLLADADHLVGPIRACGFPPTLLCLLAAPSGRPWHLYYVLVSGFVLILAASLSTGLYLGALALHRVRVENTVDEAK